jgi:alkylation response protein AidB-like acyl-CoA dehydrogenase
MQAAGSGAAWQLTGAKRYASGTGLVAKAIVLVNQPDNTMQLLLLDVGDTARSDGSSWNMRGMRGSASGTHDFTGMEIGEDALLGGTDDYRREPYFVGGIWRCAAAQLGAIEALVKIMAVSLKESGRDGHPLQMARIGSAILKARTVRLWVEDAAERVETYRPIDGDGTGLAEVVALSAYGRLLTEEVAMEVIALAERALGLSAFAIGHPAEALMRDLAVYIRQANPDAVLLQHGRVLAAGLTS